VRFSNAYTPNPICVPARATMITGNYSHKCTRQKSNGGAIGDDQAKLPQLLADAGYATYASGKLHYVPYAAPGESRVMHGFQHWASAESGRIIKKYDPRGTKRGVEDYFDYLEEVGWRGYSRAHGVGNNDVHPAINPLPEEHHVDSWVATRAIDYLEQHVDSNPDQPFFLNVGFPKPHSPFDPPYRHAAAYDPRSVQIPAQSRDELPRTPTARMSAIEHGQDLLSPETLQVIRAYYYGLISFQDEQAARILAALERLSLDEDTIVVFTADHGEMLGDFRFFFKSCMYEGAAHIPLIVRMPGGRIGTSDALVGLQDIMPTLCSAAGIEPPGPVDGRSLLPYLAAGSGSHTQAVSGEASGETSGAGAARSVRPDRELLVSYSLDSPNQTAMITDGRYKYIYNERGGVEELYDLGEDPREEHNRINDAACTTRASELRQELIAWARENTDEQLLDGDDLRVSPAVDFDAVGFDANRMGWRWY
jgi:arylsulfatase A-like enzyme